MSRQCRYGSVTDPFLLPQVPVANTINLTTKTVSLRAQTVSSAVRNLVIIAAGQSNIVDIAPSFYTPTNASVIDNFNVYDGAVYAAVDPLIGCTVGGGNPMLRLADNLVTAGKFDRVIIAPIGVGGTPVAVWASSYAQARIPVALQRLAARGIVSGTNVTIVILWGQGETDTTLATSQASYAASLAQVVAASRAVGFSGKWFIAKETYIAGVTSSAVQAAQLAAVDNPNNIWAGPNADALTGSTCSGVACRQGDDTHWSDAGSSSYAAAWQTALAASGAPF